LNDLSFKLHRALRVEPSSGEFLQGTSYAPVHRLLQRGEFAGFTCRDVSEVVMTQKTQKGARFLSFVDQTGDLYVSRNFQLSETPSPPSIPKLLIPEAERQLRPQTFDYLLVLDFEATCNEGARPYPQEIIEFPVFVLNTKTLEVEGSFHRFVRPTIHTSLSPFCTQLTGISQVCVNRSKC
jgi:hypothetical protein